MNLLVGKLLPWAGWPLAAAIFWFWLGAREDIATQVELCNQQKLQAVIDGRKAVDDALEASRIAEAAQRDRLEEQKAIAVAAANAVATEAQNKADELQATIRRLMNEVGDDDETPIEKLCLNVDVPADITNGMR